MASSLALPSATSLAGNWLIEHDRQTCVVILSDVSLREANGYQLTTAGDRCAGTIAQETVAWRPEPDGIALLNARGSTLMFFAGYKTHFRLDDGAKGIFTLSKK